MAETLAGRLRGAEEALRRSFKGPEAEWTERRRRLRVDLLREHLAAAYARLRARHAAGDRKSDVSGKRLSVRVALGGVRIFKAEDGRRGAHCWLEFRRVLFRSGGLARAFDTPYPAC